MSVFNLTFPQLRKIIYISTKTDHELKNTPLSSSLAFFFFLRTRNATQTFSHRWCTWMLAGPQEASAFRMSGCTNQCCMGLGRMLIKDCSVPACRACNTCKRLSISQGHFARLERRPPGQVIDDEMDASAIDPSIWTKDKSRDNVSVRPSGNSA